jgi:4'-phosphopantetheinyl transferase
MRGEPISVCQDLTVEETWRRPLVAPPLRQDEVHIWRASFDTLIPLLPQLHVLLSDDEQQRARQFHCESDGRRFAAARGMLRRVLGVYLKMRPQCIGLDYTDRGKPSVCTDDNGDNIRFNLSHSGQWVVCACVQHREVGIDIEEIRTDIDKDGIAAFILSEEDKYAFDRLPIRDKTSILFDAWTQKEAYAKAIGAGIFTPFTGIASVFHLAGNASSRNVIGPERGARWHMHRLNVASGYAASLVVESAPLKLVFLDWVAEIDNGSHPDCL